jgi:small subunit ribosomal protein S2
MLTNFVTIRKAVKKMATVDRMKKDGRYETLSKKERLQVDRMRAKLEKNLGSITEMTRMPAALFIVDTVREHIAVKEALKLGIPIFAMVDTNANPRDIDYVIPSNDDASKSIDIIVKEATDAIQAGLEDRKSEKNAEDQAKEEKEAKVALEEKEAKEATKADKKAAKEEKATAETTAKDEEE